MDKEEMIKFLESKIDGRYSVIEQSIESVYNYISEISASLDSIRYLELLKSKFLNKH